MTNTQQDPVDLVTITSLILVAWVLFSAVIPITSPLEILEIIVSEWSILSIHFTSSLISSICGFLLGAGLAILCSFAIVCWNPLRKTFSLISIALYSVPLIAAAPLCALLFGSDNAGIALGAIGSFLPVFLSGIKASDGAPSSLQNALKSFGASSWYLIGHLRLPLLMRGWSGGIPSAWLWAVLGALLGEFSGARWGLGTFLIGTLSRGEPARIWSIIVLCLALSLFGLLMLRMSVRYSFTDGKHDPLESPIKMQEKYSNRRFSRIINYFAHTFIILSVWQCVSWILNMEGGIASGPIDMVLLVGDILQGNSQFSLSQIASAFGSTLYLASIGVIISLLFAFLISVTQYLSQLVSRPFVLAMLITQVTPIVAFVPFIAFYFGRDSASIVIIVILSTIYPSYTIFSNALSHTPDSAIDVIRSMGGTIYHELLKVRIPNAAWMSAVAFQLATGRAMLGAITAEYLISGTGIGGLLGQTRALLDFRIIWLLCLSIAITTIILNTLTNYAEASVRRFINFP